MVSYSVISSRRRLIALLLCFFLGYLGIHRFYAGKLFTGLLWLFTEGIFGIGWFIDCIIIAVGAFRDGEGQAIAEW